MICLNVVLDPTKFWRILKFMAVVETVSQLTID
jgi:hypothetical protein